MEPTIITASAFIYRWRCLKHLRKSAIIHSSKRMQGTEECRCRVSIRVRNSSLIQGTPFESGSAWWWVANINTRWSVGLMVPFTLNIWTGTISLIGNVFLWKIVLDAVGIEFAVGRFWTIICHCKKLLWLRQQLCHHYAPHDYQWLLLSTLH